MNKQPLVLLVDDEEDLCMLMQMSLHQLGIRSHIAYRIEQAKTFLIEHQYDACLTDMNLPDGNGIDLVKWINQHSPNLPVAVLTAYGNMDLAIAALKAGAFDFVSKPINQKHLAQLLEKALKKPEQENESESNSSEFEILIGQSQPIQHLKNTLKKVARSQAPVFIQGEAGTGKEVIAQLIHRLSNRQDGPFISINCGAMQKEALETELFGSVLSSTTTQKMGLIQSANGGTLFLDEISELPANIQIKLLRAIQERKVRPVGAEHEIDVDFRIISTDNQDLNLLVNEKKFRQDLFFRIHVMEIYIPPLRERGQDIILLAQHFIKDICQDWSLESKILTARAQEFLMQQYYPGNVRELRNIIERAITLCDDLNIDLPHLQTAPFKATNAHTSHHIVEPIPSTQATSTNAIPPEGLEEYLAKIEKEVLLNTLNQTHWNRTLAAKKLGMSFRSLRYRLKKFGLDIDE